MLHAALNLASAFSVIHQHWLFAQVYVVLGESVVLVYKSPELRPTDPMYKRVSEFLAGYELKILHSGTVDDEDMMFGQAEVILYRLGEELPHHRDP